MAKVQKTTAKGKRSTRGLGRLFKKAGAKQYPADSTVKGNYYLTYAVNGKRITTALKDSDGNPITTREAAESERKRILAPFAAGDEIEALQAVQSRITGRQADLARLQDEQNPPLSVADAWQEYDRAGNRREIAPVTMRSYKSIWGAFTEWLADQHPEAVNLRDVSFALCEEYKTFMQQRKVTPRTFNANRAFLRSFWNVLADKAKTPENPWAKLTKRDETSQGRRALTIDELKAVCGSASGELRTMLAFGLYLGCRLADAACMDWGAVDMARKMVRYTPSKTARKVKDALLVPIHPELYAILAETLPRHRTGPVCPDMFQRYAHRGADGVSDIVQKHFEKCGLATTTERKGAGVRRVVSVGFHSLRHTAVSLLREAGAAQSVSQAIVGHNSTEIHQLYTHTDEGAMRRAVESLPAMRETKTIAAPAVDTGAILKQVGALLDGMNADNWKQVKRTIKKALKTAPRQDSEGRGSLRGNSESGAR